MHINQVRIKKVARKSLKRKKRTCLLLKIQSQLSDLWKFLTAFHSETETHLKNMTLKWTKEWNLSQWYVKMFGMIQKQCDEYVDHIKNISAPDIGAEMDGCKAIVKVLLIGPKGCGKTNFLVRYLYNTFVTDPTAVLATKKEFSKKY